jgi:hypothetical protein
MASPRSRRVVRAGTPLVGLLLAGVLVWSASSAAFTATTTAGPNSLTAGVVSLTNNRGPAGSYVVNGTAPFVVVNTKPGRNQQQCITVRSNGGIAGGLKFYVSGVTGTGLQNRLQMRVQRVALPPGTGAGTTIPANCAGYPAAGNVTIHNTFLPALPTSWTAAPSSLALPAGVTSNTAYRIRWTFVSTGTNAGDNLLQGSTAAATFNWELQ